VYTKIHEDCGKRLATTPKIETIRVYQDDNGMVQERTVEHKMKAVSLATRTKDIFILINKTGK
jgi:hypothetical protein